jgi:hypothetical protein
MIGVVISSSESIPGSGVVGCVAGVASQLITGVLGVV